MMIGVIFNGSEARVLSTRSGISSAGVFTLAFFAAQTRLNPSLPLPFVFDSPGDVYADVG